MIDDVRARLSRLITNGMQGRTIPVLFQQLRLKFQANNEPLSWQTFLQWCGGLHFPATAKRQNLLADCIGGEWGEAIRSLKPPPFRGRRRRYMEERVRHDRDFPIVLREYGGRLVPQAKIICSVCDFEYHHMRQGSIDSQDWFRKKGWRVASSPSGDLCPVCVETKRSRKVVKMEDHRKPEISTSDKKTQELTLNGTMPEMSKEDARLLSRFIEDHWDPNNNRYHSGWSDIKVSEDAGKSIDCVRFIRERDFGGEGDDPQVQDLVALALKMENKMEELEKSMTLWSSSSTPTMLDEIKSRLVEIDSAVNKDTRLRKEYQEKHIKMKNEMKNFFELAGKIKRPFDDKKIA